MILSDSQPYDPISIVIPTYNRLKTIKQVFKSYTSQKKVGEIVIVDDASTDGTQEFILSLQKNEPRIVYVRNKSNLGLPKTRNVGVQRASGNFILFGEDDLYLGSDYATKLMACIERNDCSIAAGRILYPFPGESEAETLKRTDVMSSKRIDKRRIMWDATSPAPHDIQAPFIHAISMVRREVFETVKYDPGYKGNAYREETDFYLRAGQQGHLIFYCPDAICVHLPREVKQLGGAMARGIWIHKYWSMRNNIRFLRRHYRYLKQNNLVRNSAVILYFYIVTAELMKIPSFYLRKYSPSAYTALAKRFEK